MDKGKLVDIRDELLPGLWAYDSQAILVINLPTQTIDIIYSDRYGKTVRHMLFSKQELESDNFRDKYLPRLKKIFS
jgi:hypothetical protein